MNSIWTTGRTSLGLGWAVLVLGAWLIISPFALGFVHYASGTANNIAVGLAVAVLTLGSTRNGLLRALLVLLGGWTYASGFILEVPKGIFLWNNLLVALLIIAGSVASETPYPSDDTPRAPQR
jgi:hypothetical protein